MTSPKSPVMTTDVKAALQTGLSLYEQGNVAEAAAVYKSILNAHPQQVDALLMLGVLALQMRNLDVAVSYFDNVLVLDPRSAAAHNNKGLALGDGGRWQDALVSHERAIALNPNQAEAHSNRGNALLELHRPEDALASYESALALKPDFVEALNNRGNVLKELRRYRDALAACDAALKINARHIGAHINRGNVLQELGKVEEAIATYDEALTIDPRRGEAHYNRGNALFKMRRFPEAIASYEQALKAGPKFDLLRPLLLEAKLRMCDWQDFASQVHNLKGAIAESRVVMPFSMLAVADEPALQKQAARAFGAALYPRISSLGPIPRQARPARIRIGYYSSDFRRHPAAFVMEPLLRAHDRTRFEVFAFSFAPDELDDIGKQIVGAVDKFFDVRNESDRSVARLSRERGIDIAVDLNGHTQYARTGIFAERCAPVQVAYLGYPGTTGIEHLDYILADDTIIPPESHGDFAEQVVSLPGSYLVNGSRPDISDQVLTRAAMGLPDHGFVFSCFNNTYKILPETFDVWMRLLKRVEGSVLWLRADGPVPAQNLRREAEARGVRGDRLVFAARMPIDQHMARHRLADLFLDTWLYNAHATAADALWAGLPVLTCKGRSFQSRVAASMLNCIGLPELIANSPEAYEAIALQLVDDHTRRNAIRTRLAESRLSSPLFDAALQARHIEAAFTSLYERYETEA